MITIVPLYVRAGVSFFSSHLVSSSVLGGVRRVPAAPGGEADALALTNVGDAARTVVADSGLDWDDLYYVGLTCAKYRVVVVEG
jgi:hypothetical protein